MNKQLLFYFLLVFTLSACDDSPDYLDTKFINGQRQLVENEGNEKFVYKVEYLRYFE